MPFQIDHVVIAGNDLVILRGAFAALGIIPDEGGVHADGLTHNALIGFEDGSYLELIAPMPGKDAKDHPWWQFMRDNAGVCAWAIRSDNIQADVALYRSRAIPVGDPVPGGRVRADGVRLEWITAKLDIEPLGSVLPFLIQDVTPRDWRVPKTSSVEGLFTGIEEVILGVNGNNDKRIELVSRAFDAPIVNDPSYLRLQDLPVGFENTYPCSGIQRILLYTADFDLVCRRLNAKGGITRSSDRPIGRLNLDVPGDWQVSFIGP